jgi:hypothetical protein
MYTRPRGHGMYTITQALPLTPGSLGMQQAVVLPPTSFREAGGSCPSAQGCSTGSGEALWAVAVLQRVGGGSGGPILAELDRQLVNWIANFIWGIADDVLRDLYVRPDRWRSPDRTIPVSDTVGNRMELLIKALSASECVISVMGAHAGEGVDTIFSRKIVDCEAFGRTFWVAKSAKARPEQVQALCASGPGYVIFVEPASLGGARPTTPSGIGGRVFAGSGQLVLASRRNRASHRADGRLRRSPCLRRTCNRRGRHY